MSIFWASQEGGLNDQQAAEFIGQVYFALLIGDSCYYGLRFCFLFCFILTFVQHTAGYTFGTLFLIGGVLMAVTGFRRYSQFRNGTLTESIGLSGEEESMGRRNGKFSPLRRDDVIESDTMSHHSIGSHHSSVDPRATPPSANESGVASPAISTSPTGGGQYQSGAQSI